MNCVSPPELDERQLLEAIDGEASPEVSEHLARCPHCRERAEALAALQKGLTARLYRLACPPSQELGDYHLGLLPKLQAAAIAAHVQDCPHCSLEIAQLSDFLAEGMPAPKESPMEGVRVLVARLVGGKGADQAQGAGLPAPSFAALRGGSEGPVTLEADGILILLDVQPAAGGKVAILGQVAAPDQDAWTGAQAELRQTGLPPLTSTVDDLGAFRFAAVQPGAAELRITPESGPAVVAEVEVGVE